MAHEPSDGRPAIWLQVFIWQTALTCVCPSDWQPCNRHRSSASCAVSGMRSLIQWPHWPYCWNLRVDASSGVFAVWFIAVCGFLNVGGRGLPAYFTSAGLGRIEIPGLRLGKICFCGVADLRDPCGLLLQEG